MPGGAGIVPEVGAVETFLAGGAWGGQRPLRLLVDRWSAQAGILLGLVAATRLVRRCGLPAREDGWRRVASAFFRNEEAKFWLACFGVPLGARERPAAPHAALHIPPTGDLDAAAIDGMGLAAELAVWLRRRPDVHRRLVWTPLQVRIQRTTALDVALVRFDDAGALTGITLLPDPRRPLRSEADDDLLESVGRAFTAAYNETRSLPDKRRPAALLRRLRQAVSAGAARRRPRSRGRTTAARELAQRLFDAAYVCVEPTVGDPCDGQTAYARLRPPDPLRYKHPGGGPLIAVCRPLRRPGSPIPAVDVWLQVNHVAVDGAPVQEMIEDLESSSGVEDPLIVPASVVGRWSEPACCSTSGTKLFTWGCLDLQPLLAARRRLNERFGDSRNGPVTLCGLLAWGLSLHPALATHKFLIPVDLAATEERPRTLGLAFIRPAAYRRRYAAGDRGPADAGLLAFNRDLDRQLAALKERRSEGYKLIDDAALPWVPLYSLLLKVLPGGMEELTGTVGVTVLRTAKAFVTPLDDHHKDGYFAFGSFRLPTDDGRLVAFLSIKGTGEQIERGKQAVDLLVDWAEGCAREADNVA